MVKLVFGRTVRAYVQGGKENRERTEFPRFLGLPRLSIGLNGQNRTSKLQKRIPNCKNNKIVGGFDPRKCVPKILKCGILGGPRSHLVKGKIRVPIGRPTATEGLGKSVENI